MAIGGLAEDSVFADHDTVKRPSVAAAEAGPATEKFDRLAFRNMTSIAQGLNPRPNARARWQRKMIIRHVRRGGRLTKEMRIARTERNHTSRSHFFKTSMKKLMPLARQIAGKSIDEAILQMRFSKKKVAQEVREHLIQARNEAIVMKGMGQNSRADPNKTLPISPVVLDPAITPPETHQNPTKTLKKGEAASETDIYVAQSWINRGPYGKQPEFRARGRINMLRPPHTGISVMLKEERTRTREKAEKEVRAIKRRLGKGMWTQLPDRPVTNQSQYVLW